MSDYLDIKRRTRRDIHAAFGVSAWYQDKTMPEPRDVTVRWHDKIMVDTGNDIGGSAMLEGVDHVIFDADSLTEIGLSVRQGGRVGLYHMPEFVFILDSLDPVDGPAKFSWTVRRERPRRADGGVS